MQQFTVTYFPVSFYFPHILDHTAHVLPLCETPRFKTHNMTSKIISTSVFSDSNWGEKLFCNEWHQSFSEFNLLLTSLSIQFLPVKCRSQISELLTTF